MFTQTSRWLCTAQESYYSLSKWCVSDPITSRHRKVIINHSMFEHINNTMKTAGKVLMSWSNILDIAAQRCQHIFRVFDQASKHVVHLQPLYKLCVLLVCLRTIVPSLQLQLHGASTFGHCLLFIKLFYEGLAFLLI